MVKRKRVATGKAKGKKAPVVAEAAAKAARDDADLHSEELDSDEDGGKAGPDSDDEDAFFETPDEKRVRLAKEYLAKIGDSKQPEEVQEQLVRDVDDQAKRTRLQVEDLTLGEPRFLKGHKMAVTCVCLSSDERTAFTGGKDCSLVRWDIETGKKDLLPGGRNQFECGGHFEKVLGVCLSEQRNLLISGGVDRIVRFWDPRCAARSACVATLPGHTGAISAVAVEEDGSQLYSASLDRSLKLWDLGTRRCMDTMLGHVDGITCMDLYNKGRPLTGSSDKTVRMWKVDKDTHLMFSKHSYSVDAVAVADQDRFLSGSQDGKLMLWSSASKKPLVTASLGADKWITALAAVRRSNVVFSGSVEGELQTWRFARSATGEGKGSLELARAAPLVQAPGSINQVAVGKTMLACAVGKEHKFGRWFCPGKQKNGLLLVPLSYREG
mmetsp:Transcript_4093/g.11866  ORF Transcript_4093/g.11866 Transcript_4093/m.11866 type:complete len:439 (+) Transcript_4093:80-1396(+)